MDNYRDDEKNANVNTEVNTEVNTNVTGRSILMSALGWLFSTFSVPFLANIVFSIMDDVPIDYLSIFDAGGAFITIFGGLMLIIWIPAAVITLRAYRRKGFRKALMFTLAAYAISMVVFFGCIGSVRGF